MWATSTVPKRHIRIHNGLPPRENVRYPSFELQQQASCLSPDDRRELHRRYKLYARPASGTQKISIAIRRPMSRELTTVRKRVQVYLSTCNTSQTSNRTHHTVLQVDTALESPDPQERTRQDHRNGS